jgi:predicted dehydrogenase
MAANTLSGDSIADSAFPGPVPFLTEAHAGLPEAHVWVDIRHFVECILNEQEPVPTGEHARHVLDIIETGYEAARTGRTLELQTTFDLISMEEAA